MKILKAVALVLVVGAASIAGRQLLIKNRILESPNAIGPGSDARKRLKIVAVAPREKHGEYALRDIAMLENGEVWAVGYDGEHVNRLYVSKDRGRRWQPVEVPGNDFTMHAITFSDSEHGWAVGGNGLIIRTRDAGKSWQILKPATTSELHAVGFANSLVGYVAGRKVIGNKTSDEVSGTFEILCTGDGGETWRTCYQVSETLTAFQIITLSESTALVVLGSHIIKTVNQGRTWQMVPTTARYISSMAFAPDGTGWVVGNHGVFQQSTNDGDSWQQAALDQPLLNQDWGAIAFSKDGTGVAVGENGTLAFTTDNGKNWQLQQSPNTDHFRMVRMKQSYALILGTDSIYSIDVTSPQ